jgi:hypothetical protein
MRGSVVVLAAAVAAMVSGCGSGEPSVSPNELFGEYVRSTDVKNDRLPSTGGSSEDRMANFAAYYSVEQLRAVLLQTFECGSSEARNPAPSNRCELNAAVRKAAVDFAGAEVTPLGRSILVKHEDGSLELITLYVAQRSGDEARLIDRTGRTYTDLEDFRANNDVLTDDDTMMTLRDITSVPGEGEVVAVTGHTASTWQWWLLGGIGGFAVPGIGIAAVVRRLRVARGAPGTAAESNTDV